MRRFIRERFFLRFLDDGAANFDLQGFKRELEQRLDQEKILIVCREVEVL